MELVVPLGHHRFPGVVQNMLEELLVFGGKLVAVFPVFPLGERRVGIEIAPEVASPALDEVGGQTAPMTLVFCAGQILGKGSEGRKRYLFLPPDANRTASCAARTSALALLTLSWNSASGKLS